MLRGILRSGGAGRPACTIAVAMLLAARSAVALAPEVLTSISAVPPEIAGRFREPRAFQQSAFGQYYVFDRRGHRVYGVDEAQQSAWQIVQLGAETGNIIEPTAFSVAPDGSFVVADAPNRIDRVQAFTPVGFRIGGFTLPARTRPRITIDGLVVNGIGSIQYTGASVLLSQPESGSLMTEYTLSGATSRAFGRLRATGHEADADLHAALNSGIPLLAPDGIYFVFQAGPPVFRKYNRDGTLMFERLVQGREIDEWVERLPTEWPRPDGDLPFVAPTVRAAAVDRSGHLWISFAVPYTYVYDPDGDKVRTVQFRGAGIISPGSLFFGPKGRLLITPGLYEFSVAR
jgi:hypothetical protein